MKALRLEAPRKWGLVEMDIPTPRPDQVLVKVWGAGICGSDLDAYHGTRPASVIRYPVVLGHEWCGEVVACGSAVAYLRPGDRVAAEGVEHCDQCPECARGKTNLCTGRPRYTEVGFTADGAFAPYVVQRESCVHRLQDTMAMEIAVLAEPASCMACAMERAAIRPGETVVIIGPGPLGLLGVAFARLFSPGQLIMVGTRAYRNEVALRLGATSAVNPNNEDAPAELLALTDGRGADAVIEVAGAPAAIELALMAVARGGCVLLGGIVGGGQRIPMDTDQILLRDVTVRGFGYTHRAMQQALSWMSLPGMDLSPVVTHHFPLSQYKTAFDLVERREDRAIKVVLHPEDKS